VMSMSDRGNAGLGPTGRNVDWAPAYKDAGTHPLGNVDAGCRPNIVRCLEGGAMGPLTSGTKHAWVSA
jgi:hypothetical protein